MKYSMEDSMKYGRQYFHPAITLVVMVVVVACAPSRMATTGSNPFASATPSSVLPSPADLVDVQTVNKNIRIEIRYATTNNFMNQKLYPSGKRCFVRRSAAEKLDSVQRELETSGLGLKIYDGYRPLSVQKKMWAVMPDDRFVANPAKGSRHNRGAAVDVTLVRTDGTEIPMPTPFDDFTEKAFRNATIAQGISEEALRNSQTLQRVMEKYGFKGLATEWWHFDELGWERYEILDIDSVLKD
jgi:D-alanyl-D-alanine dipeptidase